jgi:exosome complex exonuclease RRP6
MEQPNPVTLKQESTSAIITGEVDIALQAVDAGSASGMQDENPYLPESQRKTTKILNDSIVVVGHAKQRKRKRAKTAVNTESRPLAEGSLQEMGEPEPFDFSAVPNILDDIPNAEDSLLRKKKKQKQNKGA